MDKDKYWQGLLELHKTSGKTRKQFCAEHKLNYHTFTYWKQKFSVNQKSFKKKFIPVKVKESLKSIYELEAPNGFKVRFDAQFESMKLQQIVDVLK